MSPLVALDVAILLPPQVREVAIALSGSLPASQSKGLRLGDDRLPHITLTQQFVRRHELETCLTRVADVLATHQPLRLRVTGGGRGSSSVWMEIERHDGLVNLHERLMGELAPFECHPGEAAAFCERSVRVGDVRWVSAYRRNAAFGAFTPHVTLGHGTRPPEVEPATFEATTIAACHLGRFCSCRRVLRSWTLVAEPADS